MKLKIKFNNKEVDAELNNTETAKKIYARLPLKGQANLWGEEIYFKIPVNEELEKENSKQNMAIGDLAYWPEGNAFCIFFGKTPASINHEPRAISMVTLIGKIKGDAKLFKDVKEGNLIILEKNPENN